MYVRFLNAAYYITLWNASHSLSFSVYIITTLELTASASLLYCRKLSALTVLLFPLCKAKQLALTFKMQIWLCQFMVKTTQCVLITCNTKYYNILIDEQPQSFLNILHIHISENWSCWIIFHNLEIPPTSQPFSYAASSLELPPFFPPCWSKIKCGRQAKVKWSCVWLLQCPLWFTPIVLI